MANCLAPGYAKLDYQSNGHQHVMTLPVIPSGSGGSIVFEKKGGGTTTPLNAWDALADVLLPFFATGDSFNAITVFTQADCDSAPVFQYTSVLTGQNGTAGGSDVPWVQTVLTFRSQDGGRGKFQFMESNEPNNQHFALSSVSTGAVHDLAVYLTSNDSWIAARDNSFLASALNLTSKTNDELRKKFLLA